MRAVTLEEAYVLAVARSEELAALGEGIKQLEQEEARIKASFRPFFAFNASSHKEQNSASSDKAAVLEALLNERLAEPGPVGRLLSPETSRTFSGKFLERGPYPQTASLLGRRIESAERNRLGGGKFRETRPATRRPAGRGGSKIRL